MLYIGNIRSHFPFCGHLYVDDTDLLLRVNNITNTDEEFIKLIQNAVMDWGLLVQANGGSLNKKKMLCQHKLIQVCKRQGCSLKSARTPYQSDHDTAIRWDR